MPWIHYPTLDAKLQHKLGLAKPPSGQVCSEHIHVECARRCLKIDLTMESPLIYCREHKALMRRQAVELFDAVRRKELDRFVNNLQNCISMEQASFEREAIMRLQSIDRSHAKSSFVFPLPV